MLNYREIPEILQISLPYLIAFLFSSRYLIFKVFIVDINEHYMICSDFFFMRVDKHC